MLVQIISVKKKFGLKKFWLQRKMLVQKKLWSKKNYGPKTFWSKKFLSEKKIWSEKNLVLKILVKKFINAQWWPTAMQALVPKIGGVRTFQPMSYDFPKNVPGL